MNVKAVLIEAKSFLTEETWSQGSYFGVGNAGEVCACSHGAVQRVVNPVVQTILKNWSSARGDYARLQAAAGPAGAARITPAALRWAAAAGAARPTAAARAGAAAGEAGAGRASAAGALARRAAAAEGAGVVDIWTRRPAWLDEQTDAGDLRAHYVLGMVGLTVGFNDDLATTLAHVHAKFDEAIKVAEILGI